MAFRVKKLLTIKLLLFKLAQPIKTIGTSLLIGSASRNKGKLPSDFDEFEMSITFSAIFNTTLNF